jgi:transposase
VPIVAHSYSFVVGVDTHARNHTLCLLIAATAEVIDTAEFPTTYAAMKRALARAARRTDGDLNVLWVIEGVATYGATLAAMATDAGYKVVEAPRMPARANRSVGKSDPLDARRIAAAALPLRIDQLPRPRQDDGPRAALRVLLAARDNMNTERTAAINALTALARVVALGIDARKPLTAAQITTASTWRTRTEDIAVATARAEAVRLAKRITILNDDLAANTKTTTTLLNQTPAKALLDKPGIGPATAATIMTAWSHPGRVRNEAAFAALAGVNPIPASSGNTMRHRLNRGGDRRLNRALHMAVIVRMRTDPDTRAYVDKHLAQGHTKREIRRTLKRYLARQIYRTLTRTTNPTPTPA